ncbi:TonB-dependent receptor [Labilibacter sediminis]|nr:TonB-dependent receptor [Labilibacter sediminis]
MKNRLLLILFLLPFFLISLSAKELAVAGGVIKGRIVDASTKVALEYVTIAVYNAANNELSGGAITEANGFFKIHQLAQGEYYLDISFIGYKTQRLEDLIIKGKNHHLNLGDIFIGESSEKIDEVEVVAERAAIDFKLDKKVVNVSKQYTAISGSAVDILENVPSVTVDIEGNVFLRGSSGFTVLIDGVPSILEPSEALQQMPATSIENIEIITNPSAKYNPDGTAGIINIITKKKYANGFNGVSNLNFGTNAIGGDFLFNLQRKKLSYFLGTDYNYRNYSGDKNGYRTSYKNDNTYFVEYDGGMDRIFDRLNVRGGLEWRLDSTNTFNFDMNVGNRNYNSDYDLFYQEWNSFETQKNKYFSIENGYRGGQMLSANAVYNHKFPTEGEELKASLSYRYRNGNEKNENFLYDTAGNKTQGREGIEKGPAKTWQSNLDYIKNVGLSGKIELGYQSIFSRSEDITSLGIDEDGSGEYVQDPLFHNETQYIEDIHALYAVYGNQMTKFGYQLGLRGEYTYREVELVNTGAQNLNDLSKSVIDRFDYFPSVHLSYKLPKDHELMASYSRRIERTRSYYLEPFYTWMDAYNIRKGNPDLLPEYIDSYEINYLKKFEKAFISFETYYRITNNKVEWIRSVYENSTNENNVIQRMPENVGKDYSLGMDATFSFDLIRWWRIDLSGSLYNYRVMGERYGQDFNEENLTWNTRFNNTYKINKTTQLQAYWRYYSKRVTSQGFYEPVYTLDLALRKDFMDKKLTGVVQLRDVFATNNRETTNEGPDFKDYYYQRYHTPILTFTFTYRFNNYKPDRKRRSGNNGVSFGEEGDVE